MSRIGKKPIHIPDGIKIHIEGNVCVAKSPKGELKIPFSDKFSVTVDGTLVQVAPVVEERGLKPSWGLTRALIQNAIVGLQKGWEKILEVRGVGYRAQLKGKSLDLQIGKSHPVVIAPPEGVTFETLQESVEGENIHVIRIKGINKQSVGDIAATIRALKPPEPYKGKGIRYRGEYVRRKAGKATG